MKKTLPPEWETLLADLLAGQLDAHRKARLQELLRSHPELQQIYLEQLELDALLHWRAGGANAPADLPTAEPVLFSQSTPAPRRIFPFPTLSQWAAAALVIVGLSWAIQRPTTQSIVREETPPEVECLDAQDAVFEPGSPALKAGQRMLLREIRMRSGSARVRLSSGVLVSWNGPVTLDFTSPMRMRVREGKVTADVGDFAKGFVVDTAQASVVDLGTRFGVEAAPSGSTHVVVLEGQVEVHEPDRNARKGTLLTSLSIGEGVRIDPSRQPFPLKFLKFGPGTDEWTALPSAPPEAVLTDATNNLPPASKSYDYNIRIAAMHPGVRAWKAERAWWFPLDSDTFPEWLEGADLFANRRFDGRHQDFELTLTLSRPATVFVFHDVRNPAPDWLRERFQDTGYRLRFEEHTSRKTGSQSVSFPFAVWKCDVLSAGTLTLGSALTPDTPAQTFTYGVAAKALP